MKKLCLTLTLCLASLLFAAPQPAALWDFDTGKNMDAETGMTEFARARRPPFPGLRSQGASPAQLVAHPKADPTRLFSPAPRGMAMRTGVDEAAGAVEAATAKLPFTLSRRQGAIAFWMRAEDWDGNQNGKFHILLAANDAANPRTNELLLYKHAGERKLRFLMGDNDMKRWCFVSHDIQNWRRGEWHFVCASWTPGDMTLMVDENAVQQPRPRLSANDYAILHLGTRGWKNEGGVTVLDDLAIFTSPLSRAEMDAYRVHTRPVQGGRHAPLAHRLGIVSPLLDGRITPFEYGALLNSTFDLDSGELSAASRWGVARDADMVYFACESQAPARPPAITRRDGNVWEDESMEIQLESSGRQWQFVVNANGTVYDARDRDPAWNAAGLQQRQRLENGRWTVEIAVPFQSLGLAPVEGGQFYFTICRSAGTNTGHTAAAPLRRRFDDRANFIKAILDMDAPPVEISYQELPGTAGRLTLKAALPSGKKAALWLLGTDSRERKLYETTIAATPQGGIDVAAINAAGLAKEGNVNYTLTADGSPLAMASFKYLSPEKLKVRHILVPHGTQTLETTLALTPPLPPAQKVIQMLKDKDGRVVRRQESAIGGGLATRYSAVLTWDLAPLPPGDYDYFLAIPMDGGEKVLHHQLFQKPAKTMPWTDFQGGLDTTPPPPWTAPTHRGTALSCLTQTYDFGGRLLPTQILARGTPLLASPITLRCNGKVLDLPARWEILRETPLETHFQACATAEGIAFTVQGVLEYDGWMRLSLAFASRAPAAPARIHDLALVLPMTPEASALVNSFIPQYAAIPSGPLGTGGSADIMDHPVFWLGNAERGLFWGADSMRGTHLAKTDKSLVITRDAQNKAATAFVRIVDSPLTLESPRTFAFGIQATPVKPVRRFPKPWMFRGGDTITSGPPWAFFHIFNLANPDFINRERARQMVVAAKTRTPIFGFYASIYGASPFCPEWPWHCDAWGSTPPGPGQYKQDYPTNDETARNQGVWTFGCVADQDFLNWQLHDKNLLIQDREIGLKDMYVDMAYPRPCSNPKHGCQWVDDFGKVRKTYPLNANRTFTKRLRKLLRDKNPDSVLIYHASNETLPPICGLVDFTVEGELYVADIARAESYYDLLNPRLVQAAFIGTRTGTSVVFVSQLNRAAMLHNPARSEYWRRKVKAPEAVRAVRHLLGYCLLHDMRPQAGAGIYNEGEILERQLYSVGYGEGNYRFCPYWGHEHPVTSDAPDLLLTSFAFPNGKTLAVALNDAKDRALRATLRRNAGRQPRRIYDLESGKPLAFPIEVPPKGFRLVVFEE